MKLIQWISKFDLIAKPIQLRIKGNEKFKTIFGGFLSSVIILLVTLLGTTLSIDLFNRVNPLISLSTSFLSNLKIEFKNKFPLIIFVSSNNGSAFYEQERLFDIVPLILNYNITNQDTSEVSNRLQFLNITNCNKEFIEANYDGFSDLFIKTIPPKLLSSNILYCLKPPENDTYWIQNGFGTFPFQNVQLFLTQCNNKTKNNTCRSKEVINSALSNAQFNIFTPDVYFDHQNYENPGVSYINTQVLIVTSTLYKRFFIYLKPIYYLSDNGIVLSDLKNTSYFQLDKVNQEVYLAGVTTFIPDSIANFCFTIQTNVYNTYSRKYSNLPQIIANLGGVFNSMMIISLILNYFLEKQLKEIEILNICTESVIKNNLKSIKNIQKYDIEIEDNIKNNNYLKQTIPNNSFEKSKTILNSNQLQTLDQINKKNYFNKDSQFTNKSIIFDYPGVEDFLELKVSLIEMVCPFLRNKKLKKKFEIAEKFSNQIFEIDFIFGNLLESQIMNILKTHK